MSLSLSVSLPWRQSVDPLPKSGRLKAFTMFAALSVTTAKSVLWISKNAMVLLDILCSVFAFELLADDHRRRQGPVKHIVGCYPEKCSHLFPVSVNSDKTILTY